MMRKLTALMLLCALIVLSVSGAYAEAVYRVAGFDHADTEHDWSTNLFFDRMQEITGVRLERTQYTSEEAWEAAKSAMFSGEAEMPDALLKANLTTQEAAKYLAQGKIIDLKPYLQEHAPNLWALLESNPDWMEAVTLPTGEIPTLPTIDQLQFTNAMWINQTWLDRLGLKAPTTALELQGVLRAFRDGDPNGNGKKDEVPLTFSSLWDLRFLAHAFGINANDYYLTTDENGVVSEVLTTDANRAFITWLKALNDEGLLDVNGFTGLRDLSVSKEEDSTVIYGMLMTSTPVELVHPSHLMEYVLLDPMVFEGNQVYRDLTGDVINGTFAVTSACKDPAGLIKWVDYLYTEEGFALSEAGLEGEDFVWNDDGTWMWEISADSLNSYLKDVTIRSGVSLPGYASVAFQQKIDDKATMHVVNSLVRLREFDSLPVPFVYLTEEQVARTRELIFDLGLYAEYQMVWFITGDTELNDDTWAEFCRQVEARGADELVGIFQTAVDTQR